MPDAPPLEQVLRSLERWGAERGWVGADPFEGLNAPAARLLAGKLPRQALIQAYKRAPFQPPWPLRARPRPNAKALALALAGYATAAGARLPGAEVLIGALPHRLERLAQGSAGGLAWGYHFDVQTRHLFYGADIPNAIATCFVVRALLDAGHPELALCARRPLLALEHQGPEGPYFAYVASGSELIHNANLLVAGTLTRLHAHEPGDGEGAAAATRCAETSIALQPADGIWPYGEAANLGWKDSYHHAYCLDGLAALGHGIGVADRAHDLALAGWRERFFEPDGAARMYRDRRFPLEAHSYASAIDTLCDPAHRDLDLAGRVARSAVTELWLPDAGRFAHRRSRPGRRGLNRRELMRWTNAPMFLALARLLSLRPER